MEFIESHYSFLNKHYMMKILSTVTAVQIYLEFILDQINCKRQMLFSNLFDLGTFCNIDVDFSKTSARITENPSLVNDSVILDYNGRFAVTRTWSTSLKRFSLAFNAFYTRETKKTNRNRVKFPDNEFISQLLKVTTNQNCKQLTNMHLHLFIPTDDEIRQFIAVAIARNKTVKILPKMNL